MDPNSREQLLQKYQALVKSHPLDLSTQLSLSSFLLNSEWLLITFMNDEGDWKGNLPAPPASGFGSIEFGLMLYWFDNPALIQNALLRGMVQAVIAAGYNFPPSNMTSVNYTYLTNSTLICEDGTVLSTEPYGTFDQGWFGAFINLLTTNIANSWYNGNSFPLPTNPQPVTLTGPSSNPNTINIAIVGDWGASNNAAASVMQQIAGFDPDYIIHLGDTYYSGTPLLFEGFTPYLYFNPGEEASNLVSAWAPGFSGKSFTLNSNHEMYTGANGLFLDALTNSNAPFTAQQGLSCFQLQFGDWNILGLDSAYNGSSLDAFMSGTLGDTSDTQVAWISSLTQSPCNLNPAKTIVLTHHTGFEYDASSVDGLWAEVQSAIGGDPYAWYWGHAHNGIAYTTPVSIPVSGQSNFSPSTYARCAGHGSMPYGNSTKLENNSNVVYQANTPMPAPSQQVYNGFVMLTLTMENNVVTNITENFYDTSSNTSKWNLEIFPGS